MKENPVSPPTTPDPVESDINHLKGGWAWHSLFWKGVGVLVGLYFDLGIYLHGKKGISSDHTEFTYYLIGLTTIVIAVIAIYEYLFFSITGKEASEYRFTKETPPNLVAYFQSTEAFSTRVKCLIGVLFQHIVGGIIWCYLMLVPAFLYLYLA